MLPIFNTFDSVTLRSAKLTINSLNFANNDTCCDTACLAYCILARRTQFPYCRLNSLLPVLLPLVCQTVDRCSCSCGCLDLLQKSEGMKVDRNWYDQHV